MVCEATVTVGSSPLARGLRVSFSSSCVCAGIIPARAGFTAQVEEVLAVRTDHPRSRGVYFGDYDDVHIAGGSSPLARGLLPGLPGLHIALGIIPARAGFTAFTAKFPEIVTDHPRSLGVY